MVVFYVDNDNCVVCVDLEIDKDFVGELVGKKVVVFLGIVVYYGFLK